MVKALAKSTTDAGLDFCSASQLCTESEMLLLEILTHHMCRDACAFYENKWALKSYYPSLCEIFILSTPTYERLFWNSFKTSSVMSAGFAFFKCFLIFYRSPQNISVSNKMSQCSVGAELRLFDKDRPRKDLIVQAATEKCYIYFMHSLTFNSSEEIRNDFSKKPI